MAPRPPKGRALPTVLPARARVRSAAGALHQSGTLAPRGSDNARRAAGQGGASGRPIGRSVPRARRATTAHATQPPDPVQEPTAAAAAGRSPPRGAQPIVRIGRPGTRRGRPRRQMGDASQGRLRGSPPAPAHGIEAPSPSWNQPGGSGCRPRPPAGGPRRADPWLGPAPRAGRAARRRAVPRSVQSVAMCSTSWAATSSGFASARARLQTASWCLRLGMLMKLRASSSSIRCCGVGLNARSSFMPLKK